ncbi:MAG: M48 family metallopeptidase [Chitinophagales bacterium]|nr:M48 family metallopeptidase [Chitinophagales bacterium]
MQLNSYWLTYIIIAIILIDFIIDLVLDYLNTKNWSLPIPENLKGIYDDDKYAKAQAYHKAHGKINLISSVISTASIVLFLAFNGFAWLYYQVIQITTQPILQTLLYFGILSVASTILSLPFSIYTTFVIEEKYGFNKTTPKLFILDFIKGLILSAIIGGILISAFVAFYLYAGKLFWVYAWLLFAGFSIFFAMFYTSIIVPIFNKLNPLNDGDLRTKIEQFAQRVQFPLTNIFVIDGSKRSTKANAYFSGLGKQKTIVLYDTLIEKQTDDELVSVLAHEIGHYKKKHIYQSIIISLVNMGITLFLLSLFLNTPIANKVVGIDSTTSIFYIGLIVFGLLYSPISTITGILMNVFSRKNEFEADAYAKENIGTGEHLITALKKLSSENLSHLNPHKWFVFLNYSHPPLSQRIEKLS